MADDMVKPDALDDVEQLLDEQSPDEEDTLQVEEPPEENYKPKKFDLQRQRVFLEEFMKTGNLTLAAECADVARSTVKRAKKKSERFEKLFKQAKEVAYDRLEAEALEWATEGKVKTKRYDEDGNLIGETMDYSERVMLELLKAHRPEKFDRKDEHELSGEIELKISPQDSGHQRDELDDGD